MLFQSRESKISYHKSTLRWNVRGKPCVLTQKLIRIVIFTWCTNRGTTLAQAKSEPVNETNDRWPVEKLLEAASKVHRGRWNAPRRKLAAFRGAITRVALLRSGKSRGKWKLLSIIATCALKSLFPVFLFPIFFANRNESTMVSL